MLATSIHHTVILHRSLQTAKVASMEYGQLLKKWRTKLVNVVTISAKHRWIHPRTDYPLFACTPQDTQHDATEEVPFHSMNIHKQTNRSQRPDSKSDRQENDPCTIARTCHAQHNYECGLGTRGTICPHALIGGACGLYPQPTRSWVPFVRGISVQQLQTLENKNRQSSQWHPPITSRNL